MPDPTGRHKARATETPEADRSPWFLPWLPPLPHRSVYWCHRTDEPVFLTGALHEMKCPRCKLDVDPEDDWDHTFMGHAVKPDSEWRPK